MALLVSPEAPTAERVPALEQYLAGPEPGPESVDFVLTNYVRLALGAEYVRNGQFARARELLGKVRLDSPAGPQTALLIARSWQMQGDPASALKWYVRVGDRYPANPQVLRELVDAAALAEQANPRLAAGLYERVLKKALGSIEELKALRNEVEPFSDVLVEYAKDNGTTVGGQLVREVLRTGTDALPHLRHLLNAGEELACLEQQKKVAEEALFQVTERGTRIGSFQTMLERERAAMEERIASLEQQLQSTYRSSEKEQLRAELTKTRSRLETLDQRQAELARQRREKTEGPQQLMDRLKAREAELQRYLEENRAALEGELDAVMKKLRKQYLDLAGEGQLGKARMMREIALGDGRGQ